jgi:hypothetical protein
MLNVLLNNKLKNNQPVLQTANNGLIPGNVVRAMPMKTAGSNNDAEFEMDRAQFDRAYQPPVDYTQNLQEKGTDQIKRQSPGIRSGFLLDGPKTAIQKKWIGGNRDASSTLLRRKMNNTGAILNTTGPQSFKNPNDNNPRIDALARVRGGGARVPLKVSNRPVFVTAPLIPHYFRIISAGFSAINNGVVNVPSSTANGISPGFYSYTPDNLNGSVLVNVATTPPSTYNGPNLFNRSYNLMTIHRETGAVISMVNYDVFGGGGAATSLRNALANLPDESVIVVISTYDEPETAGSSNPLPQALISQLRRCGASYSIGSANGTYLGSSGQPQYTGFIQYRSAYVLVGIPGRGFGTGLERYVGYTAEPGDDGDPNACIDLRIRVQNKTFYLE